MAVNPYWVPNNAVAERRLVRLLVSVVEYLLALDRNVAMCDEQSNAEANLNVQMIPSLPEDRSRGLATVHGNNNHQQLEAATPERREKVEAAEALAPVLS